MTYQTTDLDLGSTLVAFRFPVVGVHFRGKLAELSFEITDELSTALDKYWEKTLLIQPQVLFEARRFLRSRINDALIN